MAKTATKAAPTKPATVENPNRFAVVANGIEVGRHATRTAAEEHRATLDAKADNRPVTVQDTAPEND